MTDKGLDFDQMLPIPARRDPDVDMLGERYSQWVMPDWCKTPHKTNMTQANIEEVQNRNLDRRPISEKARKLADHALNLQQDGNYALAEEYMTQAIERAQQDAVTLLVRSIYENIKYMKGTNPSLDINKQSLITLIEMEDERG